MTTQASALYAVQSQKSIKMYLVQTGRRHDYSSIITMLFVTKVYSKKSLFFNYLPWCCCTSSTCLCGLNSTFSHHFSLVSNGIKTHQGSKRQNEDICSQSGGFHMKQNTAVENRMFDFCVGVQVFLFQHFWLKFQSYGKECAPF